MGNLFKYKIGIISYFKKKLSAAIHNFTYSINNFATFIPKNL